MSRRCQEELGPFRACCIHQAERNADSRYSIGTSLPVGISYDASDTGQGTVLFHRCPDGSGRPVANVSKTLTDTKRCYSQIQEALAIVFALHKFHQFLYSRLFTLVSDHKPLLSLFSPNKATPANRPARWALFLSQYNYTIEYCKTSLHGNGPDIIFCG